MPHFLLIFFPPFSLLERNYGCVVLREMCSAQTRVVSDTSGRFRGGGESHNLRISLKFPWNFPSSWVLDERGISVAPSRPSFSSEEMLETWQRANNYRDAVRGRQTNKISIFLVSRRVLDSRLLLYVTLTAIKYSSSSMTIPSISLAQPRRRARDQMNLHDNNS